MKSCDVVSDLDIYHPLVYTKLRRFLLRNRSLSKWLSLLVIESWKRY